MKSKNNKNNKQNNKKKILLIIIAVIIGIAAGFAIWKMTTSKENNNNPNSNTPSVNNPNNDGNDEPTEGLSEKEKLKQSLLDKNYLLSYILKGNIEVTDEKITIEGVDYYLVSDEILKDIKSVEDISNLVNDNFMEPFAGKFMNYLSDANYNNYTEIDNKIYVKKTDSVCNPFPSKGISIAIDQKDDYTVVYSETFDIHAYMDNGSWKMINLGFKCN